MQGGSAGVSPAAVTVMARAPCHPLRVTSAPLSRDTWAKVVLAVPAGFPFATQSHHLGMKPLFRCRFFLFLGMITSIQKHLQNY